MTYLLILFVLALALAPLVHFIPSRRQREIARMREYAAVHGLFVEFRSLPGAARGRHGAAGDADRDCIYYGKRLPPSRAKTVEPPRSWRRDGGEWRPGDRRSPVPAALVPLPSGVLAASVDEGSCGVYWRETGGTDTVELIRQALERWAAELAA